MSWKRNIGGFVSAAILVCVALTAVNARAAWLRAAASTCDIISDGAWVHIPANTIGSMDPNVGRMISNSSTYPLKAYCPVVDTSSAPVADPNTYGHVTALGHTSNTTTALQAQLCTDFQESLGGVCDNAGSAALGAGDRKVDLWISSAWQAPSNSDQLHYVYIFVPTSGSGASYVSGYTVWW
jgi:hypothetical protein